MRDVHHQVPTMWPGAHGGDGLTVGQGTVIEVADMAVYCECVIGIEENGERKEIANVYGH